MGHGASVEAFAGRKQLATGDATTPRADGSGLLACASIDCITSMPTPSQTQPTCTYDIKFRCPTRGYASLLSG